MYDDLITFRSITPAQRGQALLRGHGLRVTLLRTPRTLSARGCGYCLAVKETARAAALLRAQGIPFGGVFRLLPGGDTEEVAL